jgi:hypothetical protein
VECKTGQRARIDDTRAVGNRVQAQKITGRGQMVEGGKGTSGKEQMRKTPRTVIMLTLRFTCGGERDLRGDHYAGVLQRMIVCLVCLVAAEGGLT